MSIENRRTFLGGAALASGAALLPTRAGSTAISSFSSTNSDVYITVKPGSTNATTMLNQALAAAATTGKLLYITAGVYNVSGSLSVNMTQNKGFAIIGDGAAVTKIVFTGSSDAFTITGNFAPGIYDSDIDRFRIEGIALQGPGPSKAKSGLLLQRLSTFAVKDLYINGFTNVLHLQDAVGGHFSDCVFLNGNSGVYANPGSLSNANLCLFEFCTFGNCNYGIDFFAGSALTLQSCNIASNNVGMAINSAGAGEGAVAVTLAGTNYFEGNSNCHIYITHANFPVVYNLTGAVFNTFASNAGVIFDPYQLPAGAQPAVLNLEGSAFYPGSTYANTPLVLAQPGAGYDGLSVSNRTTLYVPVSKKPVFSPAVHIL